MCRIMSSVACPTVTYFSTLFRNDTIFGEKLLNLQCVMIFCTVLSETFLILRRIQIDVIVNVCRSWYKVPIIRVRF
jgi:hypothetical protein